MKGQNMTQSKKRKASYKRAAKKKWERHHNDTIFRDKIKTQKRDAYNKNKDTINTRRRENHANNKEEDNAKRRDKNKTQVAKMKIYEYNKTPKRRYLKLKHRSSRPRYGNKIKEMTITIEEYMTLLSNPCYYCNNQISNLQEETGIGLDRIDNDSGYTIDNVLPCCGFCNGIRGNRLTVDETKVAITAIIKLRNRK
jgi:hypothetical protein